MKPVCVITGGGSGMGRATAKLVCEAGYHVILVGRTAAKLESAVAELTEAGHEAEAFSCDLADRSACEKLAQHAAVCGPVKALLHIAGMSPHMGSPEAILRANALGTVNINDAFYPVMVSGGCVIDTSSMSAYLAPGFIMPKHSYPLARTDREKFLKKMMARINLMPKNARTGVAYSISKHFVIWFAKTDAARFGAKGVRCLSAERQARRDRRAVCPVAGRTARLSHRHGHRHGRRCHCQWGQRPFPLTDISPILSIQHKTGFPAATGKPVLSFSVVTAPDMSQC